MSFSLLYGVESNGDVCLIEDFPEAHLFYCYIWTALSRKYFHDESREGWKKIFDLLDNDKYQISDLDRLILCTTKSRNLISAMYLQDLAQAFWDFATLHRGRNILCHYTYSLCHLDKEYLAFGWQRTTFEGNQWIIYDEELKKHRVYNINKDSDYCLFDNKGYKESIQINSTTSNLCPNP